MTKGNYSGEVRPCDVRPARIDGTCFYCGEPIGGQHKEDCVCWERPVLIQMRVKYVINAPRSWKAKDIEFQRNEGSWCSSNALVELQEILDRDGGCLCRGTEFEYISEVELNETREED